MFGLLFVIINAAQVAVGDSKIGQVRRINF